METKFLCHGCGACCMMVGEILADEKNVNAEYLPLVKEFPYKADEAGWCEKLDENMQCTVYEERPMLCRVKETWVRLFAKSISMKKYFENTTLACRKLMHMKLGMNENQINKVYEDFTSSDPLSSDSPSS